MTCSTRRVASLLKGRGAGQADKYKKQPYDLKTQFPVLVTCPICAFFKVKSGVPLFAADPRTLLETHTVKGGGGSTKIGRKTRKEKSAKRTAKTHSAVDTRLGKWGDFEETVKSAYLKSGQTNRKRDVDDFDESSEHIIPEALTEFIEDKDKKRKK